MLLFELYYWSMMGSVVTTCLALILLDDSIAYDVAGALLVQSFLPLINTIVMFGGMAVALLVLGINAYRWVQGGEDV